MQSNNSNMIYVENLVEAVDEEFINSLFKECGPIVPGGIFLDHSPLSSKKEAFITFKNRESSRAAFMQLNYTKLNGDPIIISLTDPETAKIKDSGLGGLLISNLEEKVNVPQLCELFSNSGEIITCKILRRSDDQYNRYGYIQFKKPQDAKIACEDLQGAQINGKPITIQEYDMAPRQSPERNAYLTKMEEYCREPKVSSEDVSKQ